MIHVRFGLMFAVAAHSATWYISPTGSDSDAGTFAKPFATLQKGQAAAVAGDTVFLRGGTYSVTTPSTATAGIAITRSGTSDTKRILFWAYRNEVPVFDFAKLSISTTGYTHGFVVTGSWLYFKGLEIRNVPMNTRSNCGMHIDDAHDNIFERMDSHHNAGAGFFIARGTGGHQFLNCDSHDNYDPTSNQGVGQNADGFGVHYQESGPSTVFKGCRAWWNSDDGWDFISQEVPVITEGCWAYGQGYIESGTSRPASGNGNGFKMGSSKTGIRHVIRNCVAWKNYASGFYANHSSGGNTWINNTSYGNGTQFDMLASTWDSTGNRTDGVTLTGSKVHILRNNIGYPEDNTNMNGVDSKFNTWDLKIAPAASDFASISDAGWMGTRQADGSLPDIAFLKLKAGSRMIDKGTPMDIAYAGSAPDLGAYEYGAVPVSIPDLGHKYAAGAVRLYDLSGRELDPASSRQADGAVIRREILPDGLVKTIMTTRIQ